MSGPLLRLCAVCRRRPTSSSLPEQLYESWPNSIFKKKPKSLILFSIYFYITQLPVIYFYSYRYIYESIKGSLLFIYGSQKQILNLNRSCILPNWNSNHKKNLWFHFHFHFLLYIYALSETKNLSNCLFRL